MGKAVLIYGGTYKGRVGVLREQGIITADSKTEHQNDPDLLIIEKEKDKKSIGITQSRNITKFLREKPLVSELKTVVILSSELMTNEAQNALLKTLEEPPSYAEIYLLSKTESSLLDTVTSRCVKKAVLAGDKNISETSEILHILELSLGERLDKAKLIPQMEKEDLTELLEKWIIELRTSSSDLKTVEKIKRIIEFKKDLEETNVNTRLAIETLLLVL
jgi:hypothetical protein